MNFHTRWNSIPHKLHFKTKKEAFPRTDRWYDFNSEWNVNLKIFKICKLLEQEEVLNTENVNLTASQGQSTAAVKVVIMNASRITKMIIGRMVSMRITMRIMMTKDITMMRTRMIVIHSEDATKKMKKITRKKRMKTTDMMIRRIIVLEEAAADKVSLPWIVMKCAASPAKAAEHRMVEDLRNLNAVLTADPTADPDQVPSAEVLPQWIAMKCVVLPAKVDAHLTAEDLHHLMTDVPTQVPPAQVLPAQALPVQELPAAVPELDQDEAEEVSRPWILKKFAA
jgi:hypothetical protein